MHVSNFSGLLAQATSPSGGPGASQGPVPGLFGSPVVMIVLMGVIFYFMLLRPQQQRAKQQAKLLSALKSGDKVITSAGLVGVVVSVKEKTVTIRSADAKFEVTKASITELVPDDSSTPAAS